MIVFEIIDKIYEIYAAVMDYLDSLSVGKLNALVFTACVAVFLLIVLILLVKEVISSVFLFIQETERLNDFSNIFELMFAFKEELTDRRNKNMSTIKKEMLFVSCETNEDEIKIGEPVVLLLQNGNRVRTSPVENWSHTFGREFKIVTRNTIYRRYFN